MCIVLKESVLKILKNVAPTLYHHRFDQQLMLDIVSDYIKGISTNKVNRFIKEIAYDSDE